MSAVMILVRQKEEPTWHEYPGNMTHVEAVEKHASKCELDRFYVDFESRFSYSHFIYQHRVAKEIRYLVEPLRND